MSLLEDADELEKRSEQLFDQASILGAKADLLRKVVRVVSLFKEDEFPNATVESIEFLVAKAMADPQITTKTLHALADVVEYIALDLEQTKEA
jgi:hypothetical protein